MTSRTRLERIVAARQDVADVLHAMHADQALRSDAVLLVTRLMDAWTTYDEVLIDTMDEHAAELGGALEFVPLEQR